MDALVGFDEDLPVSRHHDVYPTIDPKDAYANKTYSGKVVLITGASRGIGQETALTFAKAGANVVIAARSQETLDKTTAVIFGAVPSAQILSVPIDVRDPNAAEAAVQATLRRFGRLDLVIANAGALSSLGHRAAGDKDPERWWNTFEVNVRGVFNIVRASVSALAESEGRIVVVSSAAAQIRQPGTSDYCVSKHAIGRLVEFIALGFLMHPGLIRTQMTLEDAGVTWSESELFDTVQLPATTMLWLASGNADWLNGRFISANWDLAELERDWKDKIVAGNELVSKLSIPERSLTGEEMKKQGEV
ncbi:NAD-P-binding protein [Gloeopeniophorella convolvens]|nr:NAD-P-binding protein [Gloeopeniophorella convolvens]